MNAANGTSCGNSLQSWLMLNVHPFVFCSQADPNNISEIR
jgi:hypothetical protein